VEDKIILYLRGGKSVKAGNLNLLILEDKGKWKAMLTFLLKCSVHDTTSACYTMYDVSVGQLQVQFQHCLKSLINQELDISDSI